MAAAGDRSKLQALSSLGRSPSGNDVEKILEVVFEDWRHRPQLATAVLSGLGKQSFATTALEVLKAMERRELRTDVIHYNSVLGAHRASTWPFATALLQRAAGNGLPLQPLSFCVTMVAARKEWQLCLRLLDEMSKSQAQADVKSFGAAMSACEAAGRWTEALSILEECLEVQLQPDVMSFSSLISACGEGSQWQQAVEAVYWMEDLQLWPDLQCMNAIIAASGSWPLALHLLRSMHERQLQCDTVSFNAAMKDHQSSGQRCFS